jgi:hypothetical protein
MFVFNPLNWKVLKLVDFMSDSYFFKILHKGKSIKSQCLDLDGTIFAFFEARLESFQLISFIIELYSYSCEDCCEISKKSSKTSISNHLISLETNQGLLHSITKDRETIILSSSLVNYESSYSGEYIFTPTVSSK